MHKVKIDIKGKKLEVRAYKVAGGLAITPRIGWDLKPTRAYTVTHIATGFKIDGLGLMTLAGARWWMAKLLEIQSDWSKVRGKANGLKKKVDKVRQQWRSDG